MVHGLDYATPEEIETLFDGYPDYALIKRGAEKPVMFAWKFDGGRCILSHVEGDGSDTFARCFFFLRKECKARGISKITFWVDPDISSDAMKLIHSGRALIERVWASIEI
jgi:hypothetical protein